MPFAWATTYMGTVSPTQSAVAISLMPWSVSTRIKLNGSSSLFLFIRKLQRSRRKKFCRRYDRYNLMGMLLQGKKECFCRIMRSLKPRFQHLLLVHGLKSYQHKNCLLLVRSNNCYLLSWLSRLSGVMWNEWTNICTQTISKKSLLHKRKGCLNSSTQYVLPLSSIRSSVRLCRI